MFTRVFTQCRAQTGPIQLQNGLTRRAGRLAAAGSRAVEAAKVQRQEIGRKSGGRDVSLRADVSAK